MKQVAYKSKAEEDLARIGLMNKKIKPIIAMGEEIAYRLSMQTFLKPLDIFAIRTVQEVSMVKKFLKEYELLPNEVQQSPTMLDQKARFLFASGSFEEASLLFAQVALRSKDNQSRGIAKFNEFQALLQKRETKKAVEKYKEAEVLVPSCKLFDSSRYVPKEAFALGIFGVRFLCGRQGGSPCFIDCLMGQSPENLEALVKEVLALRKVDSPYVAKIRVGYMQSEDGQEPYLAWDFIEAPTLQKYIQDKGPIPEQKAIGLVRKIAEGMRHVHAQSIVHCDLRPQSILVREEGEELLPIVINFGLSIHRDLFKEYQMAISRKGKANLAPAEQEILDISEYAPPEYQEEIEGRVVSLGTYSDLYFFGKTACFLLFATTNPTSQNWENLKNPKLNEIIDRCLVKSPKQRYQEFASLMTSLSIYTTGYDYYKQEEYKQALEYFQEASTIENHPIAQFALHLMYLAGEGTLVSEARAEKWRKKAISHPNLKTAVQIVAESGDTIAETFYGYLCQMGVEGPADLQAAFFWYKKAAEKGHSPAQVCLGHINRDGLGIPKSYENAAKWYLQASQKGNPVACYCLGHMYLHGIGVAQDFQEGLRLYKLAAEKKLAAAQNNLGYICCQGASMAASYDAAQAWYAKGIVANYEEAIEYFQKAARKGHPAACFNMGAMYHYGLGVEQDVSKACEWYKKAAERGYAPGEHILGHLHHHGIGVPQDDKEAIKWYRKASLQGDERAASLFRELLAKAR